MMDSVSQKEAAYLEGFDVARSGICWFVMEPGPPAAGGKKKGEGIQSSKKIIMDW